jgi:WD40 repeat protein
LEITKLIQYTGHVSSVYAMANQEGSEYFITSGGDGWIVSWKKDGSEENGHLLAKVEGKIFSLQYSVRHQVLLAGDMHGHLYFIDLEKKTTLKRIVIHKGSIFDIKVWGDTAITCGADGFICRVNITSMLPEISVSISKSGLRCLEICHNFLLAGGSDNAIRWLDLQDMKVINTLENAHKNSVFSVLTDYDGNIFSGGRDAVLTSRHPETLEIISSVPAHWYTINKIIELDSETILTVSRDKTIRIWDKDGLTLIKSLDFTKGGHINSVNNVLFFPENHIVATCSDDRSIILWKIS